VLEKEIERIGIPTVLITALTPIAKMLGANRIVQGIGITNPVGNPRVSQNEERALRKRLVRSALQRLTEK
jgi:glycine reductase complex component B subunit gamma